MGPQVIEWGEDRLGDLTSLCGLALGGEALTADDLELSCFDRPTSSAVHRRTVTLGVEDGTAAVVAVAEGVVAEAVGGVGSAAYLQLLLVHPARRRRGTARALVEAAQSWAIESGATTLRVGGSPPRCLFRGVDSRWTEAWCLFDSLGYERTAVAFDLTCATLQSTRHATPPGITVQRVMSDGQLEQLMVFVHEAMPLRAEEFGRAGESGTALLAFDARAHLVVGAAAHSVSRVGVIGPVHVSRSERGRGVGGSLVRAALSDLSVAGLRTAEISGEMELGFYVRVAGARLGRVSQMFRRDLDGRTEG